MVEWIGRLRGGIAFPAAAIREEHLCHLNVQMDDLRFGIKRPAISNFLIGTAKCAASNGDIVFIDTLRPIDFDARREFAEAIGVQVHGRIPERIGNVNSEAHSCYKILRRVDEAQTNFVPKAIAKPKMHRVCDLYRHGFLSHASRRAEAE